MATVLLTLLACLSLMAVGVTLGQREPTVANRLTTGVLAWGFVAVAVAAAATSTYFETDRRVYMRLFLQAADARHPGEIETSADPLFMWLLWLLARFAPATDAVLFGSMALLLASAYLYAAIQVLPRWGALCAWLTILSSGWFIAYSIVALRQGLAIGCLLVATTQVAAGERRLRVVAAPLVAAPFLHWSALGPVLALLVFLKLRPSLKFAVSLWVALSALYLTGVQSRILSGVTSRIPSITDYTSESVYQNYGAAGSRVDFWIVSAGILALSLLAIHWTHDELLERLVMSYVLYNCIFLTLGFIAFSDRLAAYSWFLAPIILWRVLSRMRRPGVSAATLAAILCVGWLNTGPFLQISQL